MKSYKLLIFAILSQLSAVGQNLIVNPGFEQHGNIYRAVCEPKEFSDYVKNWEGLGILPPHHVYFTKDYKASIGEIEHVDYNLDKNPPHSGKSFVQLWAHPTMNESIRCTEGHGGAIYTTLSKPIQGGLCHRISYWYYIKPSGGSKLSPDFFREFGVTLYNSKPTIAERKCLLVTNSPLLHTAPEDITEGEWQKKEFYVVTENSFKALAIGFFNPESSDYKYENHGLYYYMSIDDIEVIPIHNLTDSIRERIIYYPNPMDRRSKEPTENVWTDYSIYFSTNSDTIEHRFFTALDSVGDLLKKDPNKTILITGYTDRIGKEADNQVLSQSRSLSGKELFNIAP